MICGEGVDGGRIAEVEDAGAIVIPVELDTEGELLDLHVTQAELTSRTYRT